MLLEAFFLGSLLIQLIYLGALHTGFRRAFRSLDSERLTLPPLSVVVAARNEEKHLPNLLQALSRQEYPDFEVIVVDDASEDATPQIVGAWQLRHPNVRLLRIEKPVDPRKKHALGRGIEAARHETLAFTDADCVPPPGWLLAGAHAVASLPPDVLLVGYSPFRSRRGLLNRLARYETFVTGYMTAAAIGLRRPYMAVGRNLFYTKSVFRNTGGFSETLQVLSGDDDLFLQQVRKKGSAEIRHLSDPESFVVTEPPTTWSEWIRQKTRHTSAGRHYPGDIKLHLGVFQVTSTLLWLAPLALGWTGALLLGVRLLTHGVLLRDAAASFREGDLIRMHPLLELLYTLYNAVIPPIGLVMRPRRW
ncbi:MAG: glycosyltransferase [Bacteroidota bacterium]